jgi:predicted N-acyltransferase
MKTNLNIKHINTEIKGDEWDALVSSGLHGTFFHTSYWLNIMKRAYRLTPHHLILTKGGENVMAMPLFSSKDALHSPYLADYGGIFISQTFNENADEVKQGFDLILNGISKISKETRTPLIYIRGHYSNEIQNDLLSKVGYLSITKHLTYVLSDFFEVEDIMTMFHKKTRNAVRKALKEKVSVESITPESKSMEDYKQMHIQTKGKHGSDPFPEDFFNLLSTIPKENIEILIVKHQDEYIAGLLVFIYNDRVHIFDNCSNPDYLKFNPNNLLYHSIIEEAKLKRLEVDFGRTSPEDKNLRQFKERWGGKMYQFDTYRNILSSKTMTTLKLGMKSIKRRGIKETVRKATQRGT